MLLVDSFSDTTVVVVFAMRNEREGDANRLGVVVPCPSVFNVFEEKDVLYSLPFWSHKIERVSWRDFARQNSHHVHIFS